MDYLKDLLMDDVLEDLTDLMMDSEKAYLTVY